ncbi:MAG: hypothetical protein MHM6MM_004649 [Cercozoa sp. M6MM]
MSRWRTLVGLEIHAQLSTKSKLFSRASTQVGCAVNSQVSLVDAATPGTLPTLNGQCVDLALRTGVALNARIPEVSAFDRKHYFYADLPQGYQITQQRMPVVGTGILDFEVDPSRAVDKSGKIAIDSAQKQKGKKKQKQKTLATFPRSLTIERIQLEQDAGKSKHGVKEDMQHVDLNRSGCALIEIVTRPDLRSPAEVGAAVRQLRTLLRHLHVCDGDMAQGKLRVDVNVSTHEILVSDEELARVEAKLLSQEEELRHNRQINKTDEIDDTGFGLRLLKSGVLGPGERVELKNLSSVSALERCVAIEEDRQLELRRANRPIERETRDFDALKLTSTRLRRKEDMLDYRFMAEPDLPLLRVSPSRVERIRAGMPELPADMLRRFINELNVAEKDAKMIVNNMPICEYFLAALESPSETNSRDARKLAAWVTAQLAAEMTRSDLLWNRDTPPVTPQQLAQLVDLVSSEEVSTRRAKDVLAVMCDAYYDNEPVPAPKDVIAEHNWNLEKNVDVVREHVCAVLDPLDDKDKTVKGAMKHAGKLNFLQGLVFQRHGELHPQTVQEVLTEEFVQRFGEPKWLRKRAVLAAAE